MSFFNFSYLVIYALSPTHKQGVGCITDLSVHLKITPTDQRNQSTVRFLSSTSRSTNEAPPNPTHLRSCCLLVRGNTRPVMTLQGGKLDRSLKRWPLTYSTTSVLLSVCWQRTTVKKRLLCLMSLLFKVKK